MNLLPKTSSQFGSADYWERFFKQRGADAFEWYGEYPELCGILHKYIKPTDKVLMIGCGNSSLSADMYDVGYLNITNVDISELVIKQMIDKNKERRPDMPFLQMDIMKMSFDGGAFSVVLDKGTLDAIATDASSEVMTKVDQMFAEISRVLRVGGRYVCVSLAQEHILDKVLNYFSNEGFMCRVCYVQQDMSDRTDFYMPVFLYVLTKFKKMPNMSKILEVALFEDKIERFNNIESVVQAVKETQQYAVIKSQLSKGSHTGEHISLDLFGPASTDPRYTLYVVDTQRKAPKFAIFIVPEGRETEWLYSSEDGRNELAKSAGFQRLVVVTLHRGQMYGGMEDVKAELSAKVMELAPPGVGNNKQIPFLSVGDDITGREVRYQGNSNYSGDFVVEDVENGSDVFRRLIFINNKNVVQSELKLRREITKTKKGNRKKGPLIPDFNHLSQAYYHVIVGGLAFIDDILKTMECNITVSLIGLGGGGLPMFLHSQYRKIYLDVVELDPAIVEIAEQWFGLVHDDRMKVTVADGLDYIHKLYSEGTKRDIVILDVDSKDLSVGMTCPPKPFVEREFLKKIDSILLPGGVFMLNLVCRNKTLKQEVLTSMKSVFKHVYSKNIPDEVNEIVFALPSGSDRELAVGDNGELQVDDNGVPDALVKGLVELQRLTPSPKGTIDLTSSLENLRIS